MWLFTYTGNATSTIRSFNFQSNFVIYDLSYQCRTHCYRISLSFHVLKLFKHPQLSSTIRGHEACPAVSEGVHHCHVFITVMCAFHAQSFWPLTRRASIILCYNVAVSRDDIVFFCIFLTTPPTSWHHHHTHKIAVIVLLYYSLCQSLSGSACR